MQELKSAESKVVSFRFSKQDEKLLKELQNMINIKYGLSLNKTDTIRWIIRNIHKIYE